MVSDNTISELLAGTSITESDNINSELLARNSISGSDNTVSEMIPRTSITRSGKTYGFFQTLPLECMTSFPQEIRDKIYDLLFQEKDEVVNGWHYKIRTILPKARLISRQLTKEYDERSPMNNKLEVSDCVFPVFDTPCLDLEVPFPSLASRATTAHINLIFCDEEPDSPCHESGHSTPGPWIINLISNMPLLEKADITASCSNFICAMAVQSSREFWSTIPKVSRVALLTTTRSAARYADSLEYVDERDNV
jgi:hypothetical protein